MVALRAAIFSRESLSFLRSRATTFSGAWRIVHGMFDPIGFVIAVAVCCVYGYFLVAKDPVGAIRKNMEKVKAGGAAE